MLSRALVLLRSDRGEPLTKEIAEIDRYRFVAFQTVSDRNMVLNGVRINEKNVILFGSIEHPGRCGRQIFCERHFLLPTDHGVSSGDHRSIGVDDHAIWFRITRWKMSRDPSLAAEGR